MNTFCLNLVERGHCGVKRKTVFTDCYTVCSKTCLLMSEPMRQGEKGETDEVRAVSHASWPAQGTRVGGEGYAGAAGAEDSSHSDSSDGTQVLNVAWFERSLRWWKLRMNANARSVCLGYACRKIMKLANNSKVKCVCQLACYAFSSRFWLRANTVYSSGATQDRKLT